MKQLGSRVAKSHGSTSMCVFYGRRHHMLGEVKEDRCTHSKPGVPPDSNSHHLHALISGWGNRIL